MSREQQSREADDLMPGQSGAKIPAINLPRASCIYQIRCIPTGKIYVGSAVNLRLRWELHKSRLRRGIHHNKHLQNAWDRYGEVNFEVSVLEIVDRSKLLSTEQAWIDKTGCVSREFGFNIYPTAGSPGDTLTQVWEGFIDPDGNEITIINLFDFCRQHNLDFPSMHRLAKGKSKLKSYKGWTHKNSVRQRDYVKTYEGFIDPNGQPIGPITNLAAFCRERGLEKSHMVGVARGRLCSHQGWTYTSGKQRMQKFHAGFVNPDGQPVIITNLTAFCREHGLHPVHMHQLKNGQRRSHKGWTWRTQDE
ncbi:MAG: GIY-YIG nuclease family protein [Ktedonobacterales bacterium]